MYDIKCKEPKFYKNTNSTTMKKIPADTKIPCVSKGGKLCKQTLNQLTEFSVEEEKTVTDHHTHTSKKG